MDSTLIKALRDLLQRQTGQPVALLQTHISWVLLTCEHAYKLKKPVQLPFADFSRVAARKHFCEEELRLNRRFAPTLYLDVVPVCGTSASPRIGGSGTPIDYLVHMRRFPDGALLSEMLHSQLSAPTLLEEFGQRLATSQADAAQADPASTYGSPAQILGATTDVLASLANLSWPDVEQGNLLSTLTAWVEEKKLGLVPTLEQRQRSKAVRECHGDLHAGNVVLLDGQLTAFDCIEFDPALRWIDVMNDVAFLTMDLKVRGRADLAWSFLDAWLDYSGDHAGLSVLRFYEVYRALVRALASHLAGYMDDASNYLRGGHSLAIGPEGGARLLITHGFSGSGKSTIARKLLAKAGAIRVRSDVERKRLFGLAPLDQSKAAGLDIYSEDATYRTFSRLLKCTREALLAGYPVIVDATFLRSAERQRFERLAAKLRLPYTILDCQADTDTLRRRVAERHTHSNDPSEAGPDVLEMQFARHEVLSERERALAISVHTDAEVNIDMVVNLWCGAVPTLCMNKVQSS